MFSEGFLSKTGCPETMGGCRALTSGLKIAVGGRSSGEMSDENNLGDDGTHEGDEKSNSVSWSKCFSPRSTSDDGLLLFDGSYDLCVLCLSIGIVLGSLSDPGEVLECELVLVLGS
jgi:hypothetical protein